MYLPTELASVLQEFIYSLPTSFSIIDHPVPLCSIINHFIDCLTVGVYWFFCSFIHLKSLQIKGNKAKMLNTDFYVSNHTDVFIPVFFFETVFRGTQVILGSFYSL